MASIISLAGTGNAPLDMAAIPKNVPLNITFALDDGQIVINSAIGRLNLSVYAFLTTSNDAEGYTYFAAGQTEWGEPQYIAVPIDQTIQWFQTESFRATLDEDVGLWAISGATFGALLSPTVAITGSSEADTLTGGSGGSSIDPGGGADTVNGGEAGDVIYVATYDLYIDGEADHLNGEGGNDVFIGFDPADFVDGGEGYDVIRHSGTWSNIMPDGNWQDWGDPTTWHVSRIEAYETTDYVSAMPLLAGEGLADTTFGYIGGVTSAQLEFFSALRLAPDVIAEGANRLAIDILGLVEVDLSDQLGTLSVFIQSSGGEQDADIIETGDGDDVLWGWFGDDTLVGNGGNDWFSSFGTNVTIDGGGGELDRLSQLGAIGHGFNTWIVKWDITNVEILETADKRIYGTQAQFNVFTDIRLGDGIADQKIKLGLDGDENTIDFATRIKSNGLDLIGGKGIDRITGSEFNDKIDGGENGDELHGGEGDDELIGGPGSDIFYGIGLTKFDDETGINTINGTDYGDDGNLVEYKNDLTAYSIDWRPKAGVMSWYIEVSSSGGANVDKISEWNFIRGTGAPTRGQARQIYDELDLYNMGTLVYLIKSIDIAFDSLSGYIGDVAGYLNLAEDKRFASILKWFDWADKAFDVVGNATFYGNWRDAAKSVAAQVTEEITRPYIENAAAKLKEYTNKLPAGIRSIANDKIDDAAELLKQGVKTLTVKVYDAGINVAKSFDGIKWNSLSKKFVSEFDGFFRDLYKTHWGSTFKVDKMGIDVEGQKPPIVGPTLDHTSIDFKGSDADDFVVGSLAGDRAYTKGGDDTVFLFEGKDTVIAGSGEGNDFYDGGPGVDTITFSSTTKGVSVDLPGSKASGPEIGTDALFGFENVAGGTGADAIVGGNETNDFSGLDGADTLRGGAGGDRLNGGPGSDRLDGGAGQDSLAGSSGPDTFVFDEAISSAEIAESNADQILDFNEDVDRIELAVAVYSKLEVGDLSKKTFGSGKKSPSKDKKLVYYDNKHGELWYDANGKKQKGKGDVLVTKLDPGLDLKADDIVVA